MSISWLKKLRLGGRPIGPRWLGEAGQSGIEAQVCLTPAEALSTRPLAMILTGVVAGAGVGVS